MARYSYAAPLLALLIATPAVAGERPVAPAGMKTHKLHVCDRGAFKRSAWNQEFGRVSFVHWDRPGDPVPPGKDEKVRCITEENLAKLKARQSASLQVIDARERRRR